MEPEAFHPRFQRVSGFLRRISAGRFDHENLAAELCLEEWTENREKSWMEIRNRGLDALRHHRVEQAYITARTEAPEKREVDLDELFSLLNSSCVDQGVILWIYQRFWMGLEVETIAELSGVSQHVVRTRIRYTLKQMKSLKFRRELES